MARPLTFVRGLKLAAAIVFVFAATAVAAFAQDEGAALDPAKVPQTAATAEGFVPKGWKIEETIKGDVTDDGKEDMLLTLVEDKPKKEDEMVDRQRALVIVVKTDDGGWRNAAVAAKLLQCTSCGGAFYGVIDAPAEVTIEKGVIVIGMEHGSRDVTNTSLKFRYDAQPDMFILIGYEYSTHDRLDGSDWSESTNYLTGKRITEIDKKGKRSTKKTTFVKKDRVAIQGVDYSEYEEAATKRLGLD